MPKLTVAFLYNIRHIYPDPLDYRSHLQADFDDLSTIQAIVKHLKNCGFEVLPIEADDNAYQILKENRKRINVVYNYSMGIAGQDRYAQMPAILEVLRLPYTGSPPLTQGLVLDKTKAKHIFKANRIPALPYQVFHQGDEKLIDSLHFPLIVKPSSQGSSAGITNDSVVENERDLRKKLEFVITTFKQPVFIEPFITGHEFSIPMLGNPPQILPIIEADHSRLPAKYRPLDSLEVKWIFEETGKDNHLVCPAKIKPSLEKKIKKICFNVWKALDIKDYCRIDIRCDQKENLYVLDVNSPPGMIPPEISETSYFPLSARMMGITYDSLLKQLIHYTMERYAKNSFSSA